MRGVRKAREIGRSISDWAHILLPLYPIRHRFSRGGRTAAKLAPKQQRFNSLIKLAMKEEVNMTSYRQLNFMSVIANSYVQAAGNYYYKKVIRKGNVDPHFMRDIIEQASDLRFSLRELALTRYEIFEKANPNIKTRFDREKYVDGVLNESFAAFELPFKAEDLKEKEV